MPKPSRLVVGGSRPSGCEGPHQAPSFGNSGTNTSSEIASETVSPYSTPAASSERPKLDAAYAEAMIARL